jgi:hypothetical protein
MGAGRLRCSNSTVATSLGDARLKGMRAARCACRQAQKDAGHQHDCATWPGKTGAGEPAHHVILAVFVGLGHTHCGAACLSEPCNLHLYGLYGPLQPCSSAHTPLTSLSSCFRRFCSGPCCSDSSARSTVTPTASIAASTLATGISSLSRGAYSPSASSKACRQATDWLSSETAQQQRIHEVTL